VTAAVRTYPHPSDHVEDVHLPGDAPPPAHASTRTPRRSHGRTGTAHPPQLTVCPCQWGATGHCEQGRHRSCRAEEVAGPRPEAYLTRADSTCVMDRGDPVQVWLAGRPCRWMCPCECHTAPAAPVQGALF
jgi:hypothetical protein